MRPDKKPGFFTMLWGLLYPFLLYQGIVTAISVAAGSLVLAGNFESLAASANGSSFYAVLQDMIYEHYGLIAGIGALCTLPIPLRKSAAALMKNGNVFRFSTLFPC